ncbi:MAG: hypothetical protein ACEY3L_11775, partial [Wolbachia sp.]
SVRFNDDNVTVFIVPRFCESRYAERSSNSTQNYCDGIAQTGETELPTPTGSDKGVTRSTKIRFGGNVTQREIKQGIQVHDDSGKRV